MPELHAVSLRSTRRADPRAGTLQSTREQIGARRPSIVPATCRRPRRVDVPLSARTPQTLCARLAVSQLLSRMAMFFYNGPGRVCPGLARNLEQWTGSPPGRRIGQRSVECCRQTGMRESHLNDERCGSAKNVAALPWALVCEQDADAVSLSEAG